MAKRSRMAYVSLLQGGDWVAGKETLERLFEALGLDPGFSQYRIIRHIREPKIFITAEGVLPDTVPDDAVAAVQRAGFRLRPPYSEDEVGTQCWECTGMGGRREEVTFVIRLFPSVAIPAPTR